MFPLKDIYKLWDYLLLGFDSLPHFISTSIMLQLRDKLMPLDFNSCIVFFSNLPEFDIDSIIKDSKNLVKLTPISLSFEETYSDVSFLFFIFFVLFYYLFLFFIYF